MAKKINSTPTRRRPAPRGVESDKRNTVYTERPQPTETRRTQHAATCLSQAVAENANTQTSDNSRESLEIAADSYIADVLTEWKVAPEKVSALLAGALEVFRSVRWAPGQVWRDEDGREPDQTGKPLVAVNIRGALGIADTNKHMRVFRCAERVLRRIAYEPVPNWEAHPLRTRRDVLHLLRVAIRMLGGVAPVRRGGWMVSTFQPGGSK